MKKNSRALFHLICISSFSAFTSFNTSEALASKEGDTISAAFQTNYYLQDPLKNSALTQNAFTSINLNIEAHRYWFKSQAKIESKGAVGLNCRSCTYFEISEAFYSYNADEQNRLTIGRKKHSWSYLDSYWKLGLWQPRFIQDELRPLESGLIGIHFELHPKNSLHFNAVLSPISIPERGTQLSFQNDRLIRGDSPWFIEPPQKVSIIGKNTEVDYQLADINEEKILFNPTIALQFTIGDQNSRGWSKFAYAFKPKNQIGAYFQPYLQLSSLRAVVEIHPETQFTHNVGFEFGGSEYGFDYWLSTQGVRYLEPNRNQREPGGFSDALLGDLYLGGIYISKKLTEFSWFKRASASFGWIHQFNNTELVDQEQGVSFNSTLKQGYSSAIKTGISWPVAGLWNFSGNYTRGIQSSDSVLSFESSYVQSENLTVSIIFDFLSDSSKPESSIWGRYRGNDRVIGSFSYVF